MLKITKLLESVLKVFRNNNNKVDQDNSSKSNKIVVNSSKNHKSRNSMSVSNLEASRKHTSLFASTKKVFNYL